MIVPNSVSLKDSKSIGLLSFFLIIFVKKKIQDSRLWIQDSRFPQINDQ